MWSEENQDEFHKGFVQEMGLIDVWDCTSQSGKALHIFQDLNEYRLHYVHMEQIREEQKKVEENDNLLVTQGERRPNPLGRGRVYVFMYGSLFD